MRPLRFGVVAERAQSREQLLDTARRAEDAGCSTLLIRDHLVQGPFPHQLAPLTSLATIAAVTTRLRLGTLTFCNGFRHPTVLAKEIATLDLLSGGRSELGIGAGFLQREFDEAGLPFRTPGDRVGRLEEAVQILKGLFAPGPLTYHGQHYDISGLDSFPKPVQQPHPPIHIGARRPRMLSIAAREGDIVGLLPVATDRGVMTDDPELRSPEAMTGQVECVREAAGDRFDQLELSTIAAVQISESPRAAAERLAQRRGWNVSADEVLAMPTVFAGPVDHVAELFQRRREEFSVSYFVLLDGALAAAAPVLARLSDAGGQMLQKSHGWRPPE